jgi:hypothetical protein
LGAIADLHEAINIYRDALALHPIGHPYHNLAKTVLTQRTCDSSHLIEASEFLSDADNSSSVHSPELGRINNEGSA